MLFILKFITTLLVLYQLFHFSSQQKVQTTRFKSMKCKAENASALIVRYCRVKVTRDESFLAVNITFLRNFSAPIYAKSSLHYKYGNIYRQVVRVPEFELCGAMKNFNLLPPFLKAVFDVFGESWRPILKGCPYRGEMDLKVELDDTKWPSVFPTGMYKFEAVIRCPDYVLLAGFFEMEIKSSILTSF